METAKQLLGRGKDVNDFVAGLLDDIANLKAMLHAISIGEGGEGLLRAEGWRGGGEGGGESRPPASCWACWWWLRRGRRGDPASCRLLGVLGVAAAALRSQAFGRLWGGEEGWNLCARLSG